MGMTVSSYDSSSISTLFSSLNSSGSSSSLSSLSSLTSVLSEYNSIQSGSYYKLLKNYYSSDAVKTTTKEDDDTTDKQLSEWKSDATDLTDAVNALQKKGTDSLFNKVKTTDEDGKTTYGYDTDKIYNAVKSYADSYNDMISSGTSASVSGVKTAVSGMRGLTATNSALLSSVGISVESDGKLSVDEKKFKASDMTVVKSLFQSTGGYAYQVSAKASNVRSAVISAASTGTYTSTGAVSTADLMSTYNSYI